MTILEKIGNNWRLKLIALLLAAIIWLFVMANRETEIEVKVPFDVSNLAADLVIANNLPKELDVRLVGSRALLMMPAVRNLRMPLDMGNLGRGVVVFTGFEKRLKLPQGVRPTRIYPASVEIKLMQKMDSNSPDGAQR